jgi:hypothetical protein
VARSATRASLFAFRNPENLVIRQDNPLTRHLLTELTLR